MTAVGFAWFLAALTRVGLDAGCSRSACCSRTLYARRLRRTCCSPIPTAGSSRAAGPLARGVGLRASRSSARLPPLLFARHRALELPTAARTRSSGHRRRRRLATRLRRCITSVAVAIVVGATCSTSSSQRWQRATPPQRRAMAPVLWSGIALLVAARRPAHARGGRRVRTPSRRRRLLGALLAFALAAVRVPVRPAALARGRAPARSSELLRAHRRRARRRRPARAARRRARRPLAAGRLLARRQAALGRRRRPPRRAARRRRPARAPGRRSSATAAASARSSTTARCATSPSSSALGRRRRRRSRSRTSGSQAQLRARVEELRASRARLVEAGIAERRRLERNLHDGAQQRLVALSLTLRLAQAKLREDPDAAERLLGRRPARSSGSRSRSCASWRAASTRRCSPTAGLGARARGARRARSPMPGRARRDAARERLPAPVEAAAYFVVAEALTNVAKYADASQAHGDASRAPTATRSSRSPTTASAGADPGRGSGPARARRPGRRARRPARARVAAGRRARCCAPRSPYDASPSAS